LIKRIILRLAVTAILVLALAVPAFAQGQVERGPDHANSICSFSGLNDHFDTEGVRVQSYGQEVKQDHIEPSAIKSGPPSPGAFCNAHDYPYPENPPPAG
jgi:hypothetical protein